MSDLLFEESPAAPAPARREKCGQCEHIQRWRNENVSESHQINFYCGIRKSRRTENGLQKVKCKNTACDFFLSAADIKALIQEEYGEKNDSGKTQTEYNRE
jgi:hypothetical protein